MKCLLVVAIYCFVSSQALVASMSRPDLDLDDHIRSIASDRMHSPFMSGEARTKRHPKYDDLLRLAQQLNTEVLWVHSIAQYVLKLPPHPDRMKVKATDQFVGWFDEYTEPQQIILDSKTNLSTLVHEMRHAMQLGRHKKTTKNTFDMVLLEAKRLASDFRYRLQQSELPEEEILTLHQLSINFIETTSELAAYRDDLLLASAFDNSEAIASSKEMLQHYYMLWKEQKTQLEAHTFSKNELFLRMIKLPNR